MNMMPYKAPMIVVHPIRSKVSERNILSIVVVEGGVCYQPANPRIIYSKFDSDGEPSLVESKHPSGRLEPHIVVYFRFTMIH